MPSKAKPKSLSTLQISQSHGKKYSFGRIVHLLFEEGSDRPALVAKFCKDAVYEKSIKNEAGLLKELEGAGVGVNVPKMLGTASIGGKLVLFEEAATGMPASVLAQNVYYRVGKSEFKKIASEHMLRAAGFLKTLRADTNSEEKAKGGSLWAEMEQVISNYSNRIKLDVLEEYAIHGCFHAAERLMGEKSDITIIHTDFIPANVFISDDGGLKVIDWEFAAPGRLGFLDTMRFIYYYYALLESLGEFGADGFHDTFIRQSNWFFDVALEFAKDIEGNVVRDGHDFRTLLTCFLVFEAGLQMDVTGPLGVDYTKSIRDCINNLTGFSSLKERMDLVAERDGLLRERDGLLRERDGLLGERDRLSSEKECLVVENDGLLARLENTEMEFADRESVLNSRLERLSATINSMAHSKSWRLTYPLRWVSARLKGINE